MRGFGGFSALQFVKDGRQLYYRQGQSIYAINVPAAPPSLGGQTPAPSPGGGPGGDGPTQTRHPGFDLEPDASGHYKVTHVYKHGPADKDYVKIKVGDYVLAIDGHDLKAGDNYWKYYTLAPANHFDLTVNAK